MSPRAACRLETLGFDPALVYDFVEGKTGWLATGLPREGTNTRTLRAGDLVDTDPLSCARDTPLADIRDALVASVYGFALVLTSRRIVLGRVRRSSLANADPAATAEDVMEPGPSTVRFDVSARELVERLAGKDLNSAIVTTPSGCLVGVFHRDEAERHLAADAE